MSRFPPRRTEAGGAARAAAAPRRAQARATSPACRRGGRGCGRCASTGEAGGQVLADAEHRDGGRSRGRSLRRRATRLACARMAGSGSASGKRAMARKRRFISNGVFGTGRHSRRVVRVEGMKALRSRSSPASSWAEPAGEDLVADPSGTGGRSGQWSRQLGLNFRGCGGSRRSEFCDLFEQVSERGDQRSERREPFVLGRGVVGLKRRSVEARLGAISKCAGRSAGLRCGLPAGFSGKLLNVRREFLGLSAEFDAPAFQQKGV